MPDWRGISERSHYIEGKDKRLRLDRVEFHCVGCGQTWVDPKGRSGDTVTKRHWEECEGERKDG